MQRWPSIRTVDDIVMSRRLGSTVASAREESGPEPMRRRGPTADQAGDQCLTLSLEGRA